MRQLVAGSLGMILAGLPGCLVAVLAVTLLPRRRRRTPPVDGVDLAARLLVLVGAGYPVLAALERTAGDLPEVDDVVRSARRMGSAAALATATGPVAPLLRRLADATVSGSPPEPAIRSYIESERRRRHTAAVERARRLPIRLMIPMALLVLPGFVLMVYGPAFLELVTDLLGPLSP